MFYIDLNLISKRKMKVFELLPDFQTNLNEYLSKSGFETHIEFKNREQVMDGQYTVTAGEVIFKDSKLQGYIIKFEKVRSDKSLLGMQGNNNNSVNSSQLDPNTSTLLKKGMARSAAAKFILVFDQQAGNYVGEYCPDA